MSAARSQDHGTEIPAREEVSLTTVRTVLATHFEHGTRGESDAGHFTLSFGDASGIPDNKLA